ncbi:peptidylprolyl isomerase [Candidatus Hydrogenedentota bacterium]
MGTEAISGDAQVAVLDTSMGEIVVKFYPETAPNHVENFVKLGQDDFYDNLVFHRVIAGFMIQGGCPHGTGTGGPGYSIDAEFSDIDHVAGTLAMARSQDPNSAGSQFYICLADAPHLNGQYTVFGQTIEGMDVVSAIGKVETLPGDRPVEDVTINSVDVMTYDEYKSKNAE